MNDNQKKETMQTNGTQAITTAPAQTALAPRTSTPLQPTNLDDAWRMAKALATSTIIPRAYQGNEGNVFAAMMIAHELQISPLLAMREVYFVNDRPSLYAEMKLALVMRDPRCELFECVETTPRHTTFKTRRKGQKEQVLTVKIEDIPSTFMKKETWQGFPANMLRWRCIGWLCDLVYPDLVFGMRTKEEMEDQVWLEREVPGTRLDIDHGQVSAPPQAPTVTSETAAQAATTEPTVEAQAPDPVDVLLSDLQGCAKITDVDALVKKVDSVAPKGHPRRAEVGQAFNRHRQELKS